MTSDCPRKKPRVFPECRGERRSETEREKSKRNRGKRARRTRVDAAREVQLNNNRGGSVTPRVHSQLTYPRGRARV